MGTPLPVPDEQLEEVALSSAGELIIKEDLQQLIPSPAPAPVQLALPREKVNAQFRELLGKGFETCFGGLFLIIPFLLQTRVWRLAQRLWADSRKGLGSLQIFLLLFFSALGGVKNINKLKNVQDIGLAVLAGLPKLPSPAAVHNYLDRVKSSSLTAVKLHTSRILKKIGLIRGRIINIDVHVTEYFGKQHLPEGHHGTKNKPVKCWCTLVAQDQDTKNPIYHYTYLKHLSIFEILPDFIQKVRSVVGGAPWFTLVFDREFFKGEFFAELIKTPRTKFITLAKNYKTIIEQLEVLPEKCFRALCEGKEVMTTYLHVTGCETPLRTIVIKLLDTGKLIALLTNDEKTPEELLILRYARRWRIENLFKDTAAFLHLDRLPGIKQTKIDTLLYLKFLAFTMFNYLRLQLGGAYATLNLESMFERILNTKARVQLVGDQLVVRFAYFKDQEIVMERYRHLNAKLLRNNIDPNVPWLGNAKLVFLFEDKYGNVVSRW